MSDRKNMDVKRMGDVTISRNGYVEELERKLNKAEATILQMHKDLGHELRDPYGTIWDECARLQKELEASSAECNRAKDEASRQFNKVQNLTTQRDSLVEALSFYADVSKYPAPFTGGMGSLYFDCGEVARKAIQTVKP